jgi:SnoaL-like domain
MPASTKTIPAAGCAIAMLSLSALSAQPAHASPKCAPESTAQSSIVETLQKILAAAGAEDSEAFRAVTTPDFFAYDAGKSLDGPGLMDIIKKGHAAGMKWEWNVTEPKAHVSCNVAWISYVNRGAVTDGSGRHEVTWLESAVLEYNDRQWRIRFLHSSRAAAG